MPKVDPETNKPIIPPAFNYLWEPAPIKIAYGGRGKAASWSIARVLIHKAHTRTRLIMCTREVQNSIKDSVHRLLKNQIKEMGLQEYFEVTSQSIRGLMSNSEFIFKGLQDYSVDNIKSLEGVDDVWLAEAQNTTKNSWEILEPTIRKDGSEIFADLNPDDAEDFMYDYFVTNTPPPGAVVRYHTYLDNPYFPAKLEAQRQFAYQKTIDPKLTDDQRKEAQDSYDNVWLGYPKKISVAAIFRSRVVVEDFEVPEGVHLLQGADFGFSEDPSVLLRCYVTRNEDGSEELWISHEAYAQNVELDDLPAFYEGGIGASGAAYAGIPNAKVWPIKADSARPDTISYLRRKGFIIDAARKWKGSVEDGISHIKAFKAIHIHTRCKETQKEARLYSYKVDKSGKILPIVVDEHNHSWDSARYALDGFIKSRGGLALWEKLDQ